MRPAVLHAAVRGCQGRPAPPRPALLLPCCPAARDDALLELANAYADMDAMQSTLADSALYVRTLRRRVAELEDAAAAAASQQQQARQQAAGRGCSDQDAGAHGCQSACGMQRRIVCGGFVPAAA